MRTTIAILFALLCVGQLKAQPVQAEMATGYGNYYYQHVISEKFSNETKWRFFNTSSMLYNWRSGSSELMSQLYAVLPVNNFMHAGFGTIYVTGAGLRPSVSLQMFTRSRSLFLLVAPRADVWNSPSFELMGLAEYRPMMGQLRWYLRLQAMTNWSRAHNRSYQYLRMGIDTGVCQLGLSVSFDEYANHFYVNTSAGIFFRTEIGR